MNHSTYLFGNFGAGYTQYPEDFTKELLRSSVLDYGKTSISIYRDGDLMYYVYIRKLYGDDKKYIGIAIIYNDGYIDNLQNLFTAFENCISNIVLKGEILELNDYGEIQAVATKLYYKKAEYEWICSMLDSEIKDRNFSFKRLPALNYAADRYSTCSLSESSSSSDVTEAIKNYSIIRVLKNSDYDSQALKGYSGKLRKLYDENQVLMQQNQDLSSTIKKERAKKKQLQFVAILGGLLLIVLFILFSLNSTLNTANLNIEKLKKDNVLQSSKINMLDDEVNNLKRIIALKDGEISRLNDSVEYLERNEERLKTRNDSLFSVNQVFIAENKKLLKENSHLFNRNKDLEKILSNYTKTNSDNKSNTSKSVEKPFISPSTITLRVGDFYQLELYPVSLRAKITKWESDNKRVVAVSQQGRIVAKKRGATSVWVFYSGGCKRCSVIVK